MTEEEKYQEIVNSRKAAAEDKKPDEAKPQETNPSGVKTDPPAEKQPEPDKKPDESKPQGDGKKPDEQKGEGPAKPSEKEMQEHAFAKMRLKFKKENDELKARLAQLEKGAAEKKPQAKTRKDFGDDDAAYEKYVRDTLKDELRAEIMAEVNASRAKKDEMDKFTAKLRGDLEGTFGKEVAEKVFTDLNDPESEMTMIIQDEQAKPIVDAVMGSKRRADLLALMQAKPQIFQSMMDLPPQKMAYRVYQLEDQIEARYAALAAKKKDEEKKKAVADSLPTPGAFGTQGNGNDGIQGLSTQQRVDRYKKELLEARTKH